MYISIRNLWICWGRNWVFATNSDFLISISLEPNVADLRYFKLWILLDQIIWVWNIKDLQHRVPKILRFKYLIFFQRLNSFIENCGRGRLQSSYFIWFRFKEKHLPIPLKYTYWCFCLKIVSYRTAGVEWIWKLLSKKCPIYPHLPPFNSLVFVACKLWI